MDNLRYVTRRVRAGTRWAAVLSAFAMTVIAAGNAGAVVKITVATSDGIPGGMVILTYSVGRDAGDPSVSTLQTDVLFDNDQLTIEGTCGNTGVVCNNDFDCCEGQCETPEQVLAAKGQCNIRSSCETTVTGQAVFITVPIVDDEPPGNHIRFAFPGITDTDPPTGPTTLPDGMLITCEFDVPASATVGEEIRLLANRASAGDAMATPLPTVVAITPGRIVTPTPTPTVTDTPLDTPTATPTPTGGTSTPTDTPTIGTPPGTSTPTPTGPTSTPTHSATPTGPTVTRTPTRTPTAAARHPTDDDGCSIRPVDRERSGDGLWLGIPALVLLVWRRRWR